MTYLVKLDNDFLKQEFDTIEEVLPWVDLLANKGCNKIGVWYLDPAIGQPYVIETFDTALLTGKKTNECKNCFGLGFIGYSENAAPHGAGFWPITVTDTCPDCLEKGICSHCGVEWDEASFAIFENWLDLGNTTEDTFRCPVCEFDFELLM